VGFSHPDQLLDDVVRVLAATGPAHISIMHSSPNDTGDAIDIVKRHWQGLLGVYPESGYFKMPEWSFVDIISPGDLVDRAQGCQSQGVTGFGGCCGLGPDHIAALEPVKLNGLNRGCKPIKRAQLALPCRHVQSLPSSERTRASTTPFPRSTAR
jgi:hypothetical protein